MASSFSRRWRLVAWSVGLAVPTALAACGDDGTGGSGGTAGSGATGGSGASGAAGGAGGTGGAGGHAGGVVGGAGGDGGGGAPCVASLDPITELPATLSETGLYNDIGSDTIAPYILPYTPEFALWSDGAVKERWAYIPECSEIDTSNMDVWELPVGSRLWKQFTRDGVRVETRFIVRTGPGNFDYLFATYHWDGSGDAVLLNDGLVDANNTGHDIPPVTACQACHKTGWRVLGFSAIQLSHAGPGATMQSLSDDGVLSTPLPSGITVPGNDVERAALGYLHANCGACHYEGGVPNTTMHLKLLSTDATVQDTGAYSTAINVPMTSLMFDCGGCDLVEPGSPSTSAIVLRMQARSPAQMGQMPPFASELVDDGGVATVSTWISTLQP